MITKNKLKKIAVTSICAVSLIGCSALNEQAKAIQDVKEDVQTKVDEGIFSFKDTYIGDNSAVGAILNKLPLSESLDGFELQTDKKPYGLTIHYKDITDQVLEEKIAKHSTYLFALVSNVETISYDIEQEVYTVYRSDIEGQLNVKLNELKDQVALKEKLTPSFIEGFNLEEFVK